MQIPEPFGALLVIAHFVVFMSAIALIQHKPTRLLGVWVLMSDFLVVSMLSLGLYHLQFGGLDVIFWVNAAPLLVTIGLAVGSTANSSVAR